MNPPLWNTFTAYLRHRFGQRVQKIPLDVACSGVTCPNRDGTLSSAGCVFCNAQGSGSGLGQAGLSIAEQWAHWRAHFAASGRASLFMAYLQSFSNTYGPIERLSAALDELRSLPDMAALSIGTRPDCLDTPKAALIASMPCDEVWLELGVQTLHDRTLARINRGHDAACSIAAIHTAHAAGLKVCAHLMAGLPGETADDVLDTVRRLNDLPIAGLKFHNVYVCRGTPLEKEFREGRYAPPERSAYVHLVLEALNLVRPDIVIHRVAADPLPDELVAPAWALEKHLVQLDLEKAIRAARPAFAKGASRARTLAARRAERAATSNAPFTIRRFS